MVALVELFTVLAMAAVVVVIAIWTIKPAAYSQLPSTTTQSRVLHKKMKEIRPNRTKLNIDSAVLCLQASQYTSELS